MWERKIAYVRISTNKYIRNDGVRKSSMDAKTSGQKLDEEHHIYTISKIYL